MPDSSKKRGKLLRGFIDYDVNAASYGINCSIFHSHWDITVSSLELQWLGLHAFTSEGTGSIPGEGTEIPQALWHVPTRKK